MSNFILLPGCTEASSLKVHVKKSCNILKKREVTWSWSNEADGNTDVGDNCGNLRLKKDDYHCFCSGVAPPSIRIWHCTGLHLWLPLLAAFYTVHQLVCCICILWPHPPARLFFQPHPLSGCQKSNMFISSSDYKQGGPLPLRRAISRSPTSLSILPSHVWLALGPSSGHSSQEPVLLPVIPSKSVLSSLLSLPSLSSWACL